MSTCRMQGCLFKSTFPQSLPIMFTHEILLGTFPHSHKSSWYSPKSQKIHCDSEKKNNNKKKKTDIFPETLQAFVCIKK